jgi:hypothetical protein
MSHEWPLRDKGFGPDILQLVKTEDLTALGMTCGDAMHLQQGAQAWWIGPAARTSSKHKAVDQLTDVIPAQDEKEY